MCDFNQLWVVFYQLVDDVIENTYLPLSFWLENIEMRHFHKCWYWGGDDDDEYEVEKCIFLH